MQVFKCALSLVFRNPTMLLIYAVGLGFMGVLMGNSFSYGDTEGAYVRPEIDYAIIDRDHSALSAGIADFLETRGTEVQIEDTRQALQDCVAKGEASYVLIIPEGYESAFMTAMEDDAEIPEMDVVYSYYSPEGFIMDGALANYMGALKTYLAAQLNSAPVWLGDIPMELASMPGEPYDMASFATAPVTIDDISVADVSEEALAAASETVKTQIVAKESFTTQSDQFCFYLQFDSYSIFAAIIACLGILLSNMNRTDMRKRVLSSPVSYVSYTLQISLACLVVTVVVWAWMLLLGCAFFGASVASISPLGFALMALTTFVFSLIALAAAFLVGQTGINATGANAVGNIFGLIVSFLGGAWLPLSMMTPEVDTIAHFLPGFWYTDALSQAAHLNAGAMDAAVPILGNIGILLLFAAALFCIGLVLGRLRVQTAEAGGNAAAALPSEA